jgi:hypothetical protein
MHAPSFRRICWTYHSCGLIAVAICEDPWYRITRDAVQEAVGRRLEIPQGDVVVDFFPPQGFLLLLPEPGLRDRALSSNGGLAVGRAKLQLLPWMRKAGAEAAKLPFRVRLCIEGLPPHARRESGNSCLKLRCSRASTVATAVTARLGKKQPTPVAPWEMAVDRSALPARALPTLPCHLSLCQPMPATRQTAYLP